ncbi:sensor domain-containing diguanylate cyclase [Massilia sp. S19_KUP03_FR1]|uniref:sensor domain-containing diguanylate cyclase n=1 Tax=Massilia sp. S19_KUP03_FR1 TaxID=3025503 RepID=UPI002FCD6EC5
MRAIPLFSFLRRAGAQLPGADGAPTTRISLLEGKKRPMTFGSLLFIGLVAFAMVCLEGMSLYRTYYNELEQAQVATFNITNAAAQHAEKTVELIDAILYGVVERVNNDGIALDQPRLQTLIEERVNKIPALQGLFVYDATGNWLISSAGSTPANANNADRDYFRYHQSHVDRGMRIGKPIISRSSGVWVVPMSRRLQDKAGNFSGVALATVPIRYFQDYYSSFDLGRNGAMLLALADGTLIARRPYIANAIGTNIANGAVMTMFRELGDHGSGMRIAKLDRVERQYSYRKLAASPLVVSAALAKDEIFASWWAETWRECAVVALLLVILLFIGSRLFRQILIRDGMERELRQMHQALEESVLELDRLARTDGLTGLSNRRCLGERVDTELARARRQHTPLAMIMIDIDFFKKYNDSYGHIAGDACLKLVSAAIDDATRRPGDLAARYGGEEFSVMLPNTDLEGGMAVARRICAAVVVLREAHRASDFGIVTISAGVYACVPDTSIDASTLFAHADQALYAAKTSGRNQAVGSAAQPAMV